MHRALSLLAIACAMSASITQSRAASVYGVTIWEQGVYDCSVKSYRTGETGGTSATISACALLNSTKVVTAKIGTLYGCKYELDGTPLGELVTLQHKVKIPAPGVRNANTGEWFLETERDVRVKLGKRDGFIGWGADLPSELVPGTWTFEIRYEGRVLGSCSFEVKV